ncbi:MAG: polysaccharide lyase family protein [Nibricoccus sp.]
MQTTPLQFPCRLRFLKVAAFFCVALLINPGLFLFAAESASVTVSDKGRSVVLENGLVSAEIEKTSGNVLAITYKGLPMLASPGYLNWHAGDEDTDFKDHKTTYGKIRTGDFSLRVNPTENNGDLAELCISQKALGPGQPFGVELHYAMRRGESGLYAFVVFTHQKGAPAGEISQNRWLFRLSDDVFDFIAIDDQRRYEMPPSSTPIRALGPKESQLVTAGPFKGMILDKYHDFVDAGEHFVHGWIGRQKQIGCWMISGSTEDQNGGPTKQYNTAHFGRILMKIFSCSHYGAANVSVGNEAWQKIYGPCLLYFNSGGSADDLWANAKAKATAERAAWPYAWVKHPLYASPAERGAVTGELKLNDPQDANASAANAWVGLAEPSPDWQQQSNNYQYWVRADNEGRFTIRHVRPGRYTLCAFVDGVMGEFRRDNVTVSKGETLDLHTIDWIPPRHGRQLWQIGKPDRTAKEFRHGDDYRRWGLWLQYPKDFPKGVNFTIGKSNERTDWNYAQVNVQQGKDWVGTTWKVLFEVDTPLKRGKGTLSVALAAATKADLEVALNGRSVGTITTGSDSAMMRAGIHGQYSLTLLRFNADLMKKGTNELTLTQRSGRSAQKNVMYDCLRLEVEEDAAKK